MKLRIRSKKYGEFIAEYDDELRYLIDQYTWSINIMKGKPYAVTNVRDRLGKVSVLHMSRLVYDEMKDSGKQIRHVDGNTLDNRKLNLIRIQDSKPQAV